MVFLMSHNRFKCAAPGGLLELRREATGAQRELIVVATSRNVKRRTKLAEQVTRLNKAFI